MWERKQDEKMIIETDFIHYPKCIHQLQIHVHNVTDNIDEFMCLICGWSKSDESS